jgi:hypothetical protein
VGDVHDEVEGKRDGKEHIASLAHHLRTQKEPGAQIFGAEPCNLFAKSPVEDKQNEDLRNRALS